MLYQYPYHQPDKHCDHRPLLATTMIILQGVVYYIKCISGKKECARAHYVGRAWTSDSTKYPMRLRWSVHKSHFKTNYNGCKLTTHLLDFHKGEDAQALMKVVILEQSSSLQELIDLEVKWTRRLFCYVPTGLNIREEDNNMNYQ